MAFRGDLEIYTVDSFSSVPFSGNPAGVCLDPTKDGLPDDVLRKVTAELNLSATGFVRKLSENDDFRRSNKFGIRWFSTEGEMRLCGHGTLAAAAVLFRSLGNPSQVLYFDAKLRGETLEARQNKSGIVMVLPADPPSPPPDTTIYEDLIKASVRNVPGDDPVQDVQYGQDTSMLLVRLKDDVLTRSEFEALDVPTNEFPKIFPGKDLRSYIITMKGSPGNGCHDASGEMYDFVSRVFDPWWGIPEDICTGSAHTLLGPYWSKILGKNKLYARQCSERGGELHLHVKPHDVDITGQTTMMLSGTMSI